jgi:hypothetical protein
MSDQPRITTIDIHTDDLNGGTELLTLIRVVAGAAGRGAALEHPGIAWQRAEWLADQLLAVLNLAPTAPAPEQNNTADQAGRRTAQRPPAAAALPGHLRGAGPCHDCGGDTIIWRPDSDLWFRAVGGHPEVQELCIPCFVARVDAAGLAPEGWRLLADWHPETRSEQTIRRAAAAAVASGEVVTPAQLAERIAAAMYERNEGKQP